MKNSIKYSSVLLMVLLGVNLSGCKDHTSEAEQAMANIRNEYANPIEPIPEIVPIADFVYSASQVRDPFLAPSQANLRSVSNRFDNGVRPDLTRIKEPLEKYELTQLVYRGKIVSPDGKQYGLIQRPDGSITNVQVGDYMGINDGRIVEITPTQINLIEIVPDSRSGFVERPQSIVSPIS